MAAPAMHARETTRRRDRYVWLAASAASAAICALAAGLFIVSLPARFRQLLAIGAGDASLADPLRGTDPALIHAALARLNVSVGSYAAANLALEVVFALTFGLVAAAIAWRGRDRGISLLGALTLVLVGTTYPPTLEGLARAQPAFDLPARLLDGGHDALGLVMFYVFPDGRFVPRWTIPLALGWVAWNTFSAIFPAASVGPPAWPPLLALLATVPWWLSGVLAQAYRYRNRSSPAQRQQTKWVLWGLTAAVVGPIGTLLLPHVLLLSRSPTALEATVELGAVPLGEVFLLFAPLSLGVAILHYRLWDIDVLINRTLVYGALSLLLAGVYLGGVVLLQSALRALTGQTSDLATVGSTLAVAATAQPLRQRLQSAIDRRFYRRKYDATRVLRSFGTTARDEVDLGRLTTELLHLVEDTMQPAHVSLWLRPVRPEARRGQVDPAT